MLFNSTGFALFLPVVFLLYWFVFKKSLRLQNLLLLAASYFFYACWDWRFLFLLLFSTLLDYYSGLKIEEHTSPAKRKFWFWLSIFPQPRFSGGFSSTTIFLRSPFPPACSSLGLRCILRFWMCCFRWAFPSTLFTDFPM